MSPSGCDQRGALDGVVLELSWAADDQAHSVDGAGTYRFPLPHGLAHDSLCAQNSVLWRVGVVGVDGESGDPA